MDVCPGEWEGISIVDVCPGEQDRILDCGCLSNE